MVLGVIPLIHYNTAYPYTAENFSSSFQKYQSELYWDEIQQNLGDFRYTWDQMGKYLSFEIISFEPNSQKVLERIDNLKNIELANLLNKVKILGRSNGSSFTKDVSLVVYSDIDNRIPVVSKISGYNAFYQSLIGGNRNTKMYTISGMGIRWSDANIRKFVIEAWDAVYHTDITTAYDLSPIDWIDTIWVQTNKRKNLYHLPSGDFYMDSGNHSNRRGMEYLAGANSLVPQNSTFNFTANKAIFQFNAKTGNYGSFEEVNEARATQTQLPITSVMLRGLSGTSHKAIYLKPFGGIDTFCFPKFDNNQYRLEAEFSRDGNRRRFRIMEIPLVVGSGGNDKYTERLRRDQFWIGGSSLVTVPNKNKQKDIGWNIRFYLRDLNTGDVSPMSDIGIIANYGKMLGYSAIDYKIHRF